MNQMPVIVFLSVFITLACRADTPQDIKYAIVGMNFYHDHDEIQIVVPPWLSQEEVKVQVEKAIIWPGDPPPEKEIIIYIFKETDLIENSSSHRATFHPQNGFQWHLSHWQPAELPDTTPSWDDMKVYNFLIDQTLEKGITFHNIETRKEVARKFNLTVSELDSIYVMVKYWLGNTQKK